MIEALKSYSFKQLDRLYRRCWDRMTRHDGYQPFGYDSVTLWAVHPGWMTIITACRNEYQRRKAEIDVAVGV